MVTLMPKAMYCPGIYADSIPGWMVQLVKVENGKCRTMKEEKMDGPGFEPGAS